MRDVVLDFEQRDVDLQLASFLLPLTLNLCSRAISACSIIRLLPCLVLPIHW